MPSYLLRWLSTSVNFLIVILTGFNPFAVKAQETPKPVKPAGEYLHEKLVKTQKEYDQALAKGDSMEVAEMCYRLGKRYLGLGDFKIAQNWFVRSLRIREARGPSEAIGKVYLFMSHYQIQQKKYAQARQTLRLAMTNFKSAGSRHGLMSGNLAMAGIHELGFKLNQDSLAAYPRYSFDSALYYYQQAEKFALLLQVPYDVANIYFCKGAFLVKANAKPGIAYLKKADAIFSKEKSAYALINTSLTLADTYLSLRQPAQSKRWLDKARYIIDSSRLGDNLQQSKLFMTYARFYEQTGNWQEALKAQKKYYELTMDAMSADREGAITRIGVEYETQKKETRLNMQQKELSLQRRLIWVVMGGFILSVIASAIFYRFFQKYKYISRQNATLVMEQNHRVKNNLQEVTNLLTLQSNRLTNEDAKKAVTEGLLRMEAMSLIHQRLYNSDRLIEINLPDFIPELVEGVLRCYGYFHMQPVYTLEPIWLHVDQAVPLGLIMNELVTNSCKYAFSAQYTPTLSVTCQQINHAICLEIIDNGPGFDAQNSQKTFGLKLIQALTQRLKGQAHFSGGGNAFRLTFPVLTAYSVH